MLALLSRCEMDFCLIPPSAEFPNACESQEGGQTSSPFWEGEVGRTEVSGGGWRPGWGDRAQGCGAPVGRGGEAGRRKFNMIPDFGKEEAMVGDQGPAGYGWTNTSES